RDDPGVDLWHGGERSLAQRVRVWTVTPLVWTVARGAQLGMGPCRLRQSRAARLATRSRARCGLHERRRYRGQCPCLCASGLRKDGQVSQGDRSSDSEEATTRTNADAL